MRSAVILVACLVAARPAAADNASDALDLAKQAEAAAQGGDFAGAVTLFKQAVELDARPEYQCNIGVAYFKGGDLPRAQLFLSLCLARGSHLDATFLGGVRAVLVSVEDTMRAGEFTPVDIVVTPQTAEIVVSAFAEDEVIVGSRQIWLPVGDHVLQVSAIGFETQIVPMALTGHDLVRVPVTLEPIVYPSDPPPEEPVPPPTIVDHRRGWRIAAYGATAVTAVAALGTVGLYVRAWGAATDAGELPPGERYDDAAQVAKDRVGQLNIGYAVTAVCAAATGVLWYLSRPREITVVAAPTSDGASVSIGGRF